MKRFALFVLVLLALVVSSSPAAAQIPPAPNVPVFGLPFAFVSPTGSFLTPLFGPTSTCATPAYAFTGGTNYGMNLSGTTLQLCINGSAQMQLTNNGLFANDVPVTLEAAGVNKFSIQKNGSTDGQALLTRGDGTVGVGLDVATDGTLKVRARSLAAGSGNFDVGAKITGYNNLTTTGNGVTSIVATGSATGLTAADTNRCTFTPAADGSFEVSDDVLVTTATNHSFGVNISYRDEGNTARTINYTFYTLAGYANGTAAIVNANGAVPYHGVVLHLRAKAGTAITLSTAGTFTTVTYNHDCSIRVIS